MGFSYETFAPRPGAAIAYRRLAPENAEAPGVIFLGGFRSDMQGTKAAFLEDRCAARGQAFLRFDYGGHGLSYGSEETATIGSRLRDALDVLDRLTAGPQVAVGSSMGGWITLLLALRRPERLAGLVLVAPAPDFTEDVYQHVLTPAQRAELDGKGVITLPQDGGPPALFTKNFREEARDNHLLLHKKIPVPCPVRILHGREDKAVSWKKSEKIIAALDCPDAKIIWVPDGDHRLSREQDLDLLDETILELSRA
jgi:pimeloyl-ACP methyl ester carboxylesterase